MHDHFMRYRWDYETLHVQEVVHARLSTPISVSRKLRICEKLRVLCTVMGIRGKPYWEKKRENPIYMFRKIMVLRFLIYTLTL